MSVSELDSPTEARPSDGIFRSLLSIRVLVLLAIFGACTGLGAELMARLDDLLFDHVPFLANPSDEDLYVRDVFGRRGAPHGHFKKWKLNNYGFRGQDIALEPPPGCTRMVALGASETFGLYESPGKEYPAALAIRLASGGHCTEVLNAGIPGMTMRTMIAYWKTWIAQFKPSVVLIYPSPQFFLGEQSDAPPAAAPPSSAPPSRPAPPPAALKLQSRFMARLHDVIHTPAPIQMIRDQKKVDALLKQHRPEWEFREVPPARLEQLRTDLTELIEAVRATGAQPVLLTHAMRARLPIDKDDLPDLWSMRTFTPQATPEVLVAFNTEANRVIQEVGTRSGVVTLDTASVLEGCRECFGDLVHFSDKGAARFVDTVAHALVSNQIVSGNHAVQ